MTALELISRAREHGVTLTINQTGKLMVHPDLNELPQDLVVALQQNKSALIKLIRASNTPFYRPQLSKLKLTEAPLTHAQMRLWLQEQHRPMQHIIRAVYNISGKIDTSRLEAAISDLIRQCVMLKAHVVEKCSGVFQVLNPNVALTDVYQHIKTTKEELPRLISDTLAEIFQAGQPLFQCVLFEVTPERFSLLFKLHHLISDGVSMQTLFAQLSRYYQGDNAINFNEEHDYLDFANWESGLEANTYYQPYIDYWLEQLNGFEALNLPKMTFDNELKNNAASYQLRISKEISQLMQRLAAQHGVTENVICLSALYITLSKYADKQDLVVGLPVANRFILKLQDSVGLFVNTLPLRVDLKGITTTALIANVQENLVAALDHAQAPFNRVFDQLEPSQKKQNAFEVIFNYFSGQNDALRLTGVSTQPTLTQSVFATTPLSIAIKENKRAYELLIDYDRNQFEESHITCFCEQFLIALTCLKEERAIVDISLLSKKARNEMLVDWNSPNRVYAKDMALHQGFEEQVQRSPNKIAVVFLGQELTYKDLNTKANKLARYICAQYYQIHKHELPADTLIGICVERSLDMIVIILAILKAGAAYVPLDVHHPEDRLASIIEDSGLSLLISHDSVMIHLQHLCNSDLTLLLIDDQETQDILSRYGVLNLNKKIDPDSLAYVIYTSGSTGKPKGVMLSHHNATRLFLATNDDYHFNEKDIWSLFHSYAFDLSVWEIFGALSYGGKLVIIPHAITKDMAAFYQLAHDQGVTVLNQTPGAFQQFIHVDTMQHRPIKSLRYVIFAGDALHIEILRPWWDKHTDTAPELINMYGITEASVHVTYGLLKKWHLTQNRLGFIGHAISDLQVYVLDKQLNLCPVGVPGELYVGGAGLARGYLNRADLTSSLFIKNPFAKEIGLPRNDIIYKSGDRVRWVSDGKLEYIGRLDFQVKIRGYRIELGEIENRLTGFDQIIESCAAVKEAKGQKYIVGYYVSHSGEELESRQLRSYLLQTLPDYMLPNVFMKLEKLPLTSNCKINRKALPMPSFSIIDDALYCPPKGEVEQAIAKVWRHVLNILKAGRNNNFFHLGGDSISLMQVIAVLRQKGMYLTVQAFYDAHTLADLARRVVLKEPVVEEKTSPVIGKQTLTPIQHWFFEGTSNPNHANQLFRLKVAATLNLHNLKTAIDHLTRYHDVFALRFHCSQGRWQAKYSAGNNYIFKTYDLSGLTAKDQAAQLKQIGQNQHASLDITEGPLAAFIHFKLGEADERVLVIINHLIIDGVSWRILIEDLSQLYSDLQAGKDLTLRLQKSSSYQLWGNTLAQSTVDSKTVAYWEEFSQGESQSLPVDFKRGDNNYASSDRFRYVISKELSKCLLTESVQDYAVHINALMLSALSLALNDCFGLTKVAVDLESHGRTQLNHEIDFTRTVGWFTNIYPIILDKSHNYSYLEGTKAIDAYLNSIPNAGNDALLLKYGEYRRSGLSAFNSEISFNYLGQFHQSIFQDSIFEMAHEYYGEPMSPENPRRHVLNIVAVIIDGALQIDWNYSNNQFASRTIQQVAKSYANHLEKIIIGGK